MHDRLALAGQKRFVRRAEAVADQRVGRDLIADVKHAEIALDQLLRRAFPLDAPTDHRYGAILQKAQFFQRRAGAKLLHRADEGIGEHDAQKEHVPPGI